MLKSVEKDGVGNCMISHGSWDKSKNPYPLRNCFIPKATVKGPGTTQPVASWFLVSDCCLFENYVISQWVWVLAIFPYHSNVRRRSEEEEEEEEEEEPTAIGPVSLRWEYHIAKTALMG